MNKAERQRLDQLVRQGIIPVEKQNILMKAMASLYNGSQLAPVERDVLSKYMHNMTDIILKDTTVFNRAKLHTQKTRYRTEENTVEDVEENVKVLDGPEELERFRKGEEEKAKKKTKGARAKFRNLPPELRKEKMKAGLGEDVEDILDFNEDYSQRIQLALEYYGFESIRDLPEELKSEFFQVVDEAAHITDQDFEDLEESENVDEARLSPHVARRVVKSTRDLSTKHKRVVKNFVDGLQQSGRKKKLNMPEEVEQTDEAYDNDGKQVRSMDRPNYVSKDPSQSKRRARFAAKVKAKARKQMYREDVKPAEDVEEAMTPEAKAKRLEVIKKAVAKVQNGNNAASAAARKDAKRDMNNEEMSPEFKKKRLETIKKAVDKVQNGNNAAATAARKDAKRDIKNEENEAERQAQLQELRTMIKEGNNKLGAYKLLSQILNKETGEQ
jgi:hypothetical protein